MEDPNLENYSPFLALFFSSYTFSWSWPINSKHHSMLSPAIRPRPAPLTWALAAAFWLASLLPASSQSPHQHLGYSQVQNWSSHFLLKNLQWHPFTNIKLLYLHPFHDLEPRIHVSMLISLPQHYDLALAFLSKLIPRQLWSNKSVSLCSLQAPQNIDC